ncbi:MAG: methylenetetrahydrofolate reductase [NAD(P)H] [Citromicrobium sp.]|nr:methylenetetrahydrofolate reductase [NAD(P)H] [Citromicrobium sp.]
MTAQPTPPLAHGLDPAQERTRAKNDPLFSGLPGDIDASFEFFPPKNEKMEESLWNAVQELKPLDPHFVSVTYGAGGSTRERTHKTVARIIQEAGLPAAAHLTCVNASRKETQRIAEQYWEAGVRHIVALRGDMPQEDGSLGPFKPHPEGYNSAEELVHGLKEVADFEISVSAYPEMHPDAKSQQEEIDYLKRKIDAGADRAITQFFFSPNTFFDYLEKTDKAGIDVPIVPGVLPITNVAKARQFAGQNGAEFPDWMDDLFEGLDDRPSARKLVAATVAGEMCRRLYAGGIRHYHFYTLNRADLAYSICHLLGMRPKGEGEKTA